MGNYPTLNTYILDKCQRKQKVQSGLKNPEKLATLGTQDTKRRQKKIPNKNTIQHMLDTTILGDKYNTNYRTHGTFLE